MRSFNVVAPRLDRSSEREGYRWRGARVGEALGAEQIGGCLYQLAAGQRTHPYHFHHGVEEWLLVVAGTPTLRTPDGDRVLGSGDVVCFPAGPVGGHQLSGPGTILVVSETRAHDTVEYPDRGTISVRPPGITFRRADAVDDDWPAPPEVVLTVKRALGRMTQPPNLYGVPVESDPADPPGYRARTARLGPSVGAERLGATVYELDPQDSVCPYHYEGIEEEWLLVLTGTPTLRDPDGEHELAPGDLVCFPPGPDGAHKVTNRSHATTRILMLSTIPPNELSICVYPDSIKIGVWPWPGARLRLTDTLDYWDGEI